MMNCRKYCMDQKRRAFTMIDIIFAVLFIFILLIVGLKFIFTSKEMNQNALLKEDAMFLVSNAIEEYQDAPKRGEKQSFHYDVSLDETEEGNAHLSYRLDLESEVQSNNLDLLRLTVYEEKGGEEILSTEIKIYIPESKRALK